MQQTTSEDVCVFPDHSFVIFPRALAVPLCPCPQNRNTPLKPGCAGQNPSKWLKTYKSIRSRTRIHQSGNACRLKVWALRFLSSCPALREEPPEAMFCFSGSVRVEGIRGVCLGCYSRSVSCDDRPLQHLLGHRMRIAM